MLKIIIHLAHIIVTHRMILIITHTALFYATNEILSIFHKTKYIHIKYILSSVREWQQRARKVEKENT